VFQAFHILPYLTVAQNVALPLALNGIGKKPMRRRVAALLDSVKLGDRGESMPHELSGGEMQRVAIARALVHRPRLVFADEPTGNLDPESAREVLALLRECVKSEGAAGILVTHSSAAARTADRTYVLTQRDCELRKLARSYNRGAHGQKNHSDRRGVVCSRLRRLRRTQGRRREGLHACAAQAGRVRNRQALVGRNLAPPVPGAQLFLAEGRHRRLAGQAAGQGANGLINVDCYGDKGLFSFGSESFVCYGKAIRFPEASFLAGPVGSRYQLEEAQTLHC